jgi:TolC family type I secretion outer membrane protein
VKANLWFSLFFFCGPLALAEETLPVTLEEACSLAYQTNPQLKAARLGVEALDEEYNKALSGFRPHIEAFGDAGYTDGTVDKRFDQEQDRADSRNSSALGFVYRQPLYRGGKTMAEKDLAVAQIAAGREELRRQTQEVLLKTIQAYADVVAAEGVLAYQRQYQKAIKDNVGTAEAHFKAGDLTATDVFQSKARWARAQTELRQAERDLAARRADFMAVVGVLPGTLQGFSPPPKLPKTLAAATDHALKKNPILRAANYKIQTKDAEVDRISAGYLPELAVESQVSREENPSFDDRRRQGAETKLVLKIPLYDGGMVSSWVRQAKKERQQASYEKDDAYRRVIQEVTLAWNDLQAVKSDLESTALEVQSSQEAVSGVREEFNLSFRSTLDVLNAEQEVLSAQRRLMATKRNQMVAQYGLLASMGALDIHKVSKKTKKYDPDEHFNRVENLWYGWWQE